MSGHRDDDLQAQLLDAAVFAHDAAVGEAAERAALAAGDAARQHMAEWEGCAALVAGAMVESAVEPVPSHLWQRLRGDAMAAVAELQQVQPRQRDIADAAPASPRTALRWFSWAAIVTATAVLAWSMGARRAAPQSPQVERAAMLAAEPDLTPLDWGAGPNPAGAGISGDVVWSVREQRGFLRLRGLRSNDPARAQYQLWIVDAARGMPPVDGGVFDVPAGGGELVVPIDAKLSIAEAQLFVITEEPPGGVVVSERGDRVVAVAGG